MFQLTEDRESALGREEVGEGKEPLERRVWQTQLAEPAVRRKSPALRNGNAARKSSAYPAQSRLASAAQPGAELRVAPIMSSTFRD